MANTQTLPNRELVADNAVAIVFATEKSQPLVASDYASKAGAVTYASARAALKKSEPKLTGDALTERVNQMVNAYHSTTLAGVLQLAQEGFHITKFNGRKLKNGTRNVSVAMTDRKDIKAKAAKKATELSVAELRELLAIAEKLETAETAPTIDI